MRRLRLTDRAFRDLDRTLETSHTNFGADGARRYDLLVRLAFTRIRVEPGIGVVLGGALSEVRQLHLERVRKLAAAPDRVRFPRHIVFYIHDDQSVTIVAILHERMNLRRRLRARRPLRLL